MAKCQWWSVLPHLDTVLVKHHSPKSLSWNFQLIRALLCARYQVMRKKYPEGSGWEVEHSYIGANKRRIVDVYNDATALPSAYLKTLVPAS